MFLISTLSRLDVWPTGDYGVRAGFARAWGLAEVPAPKELDGARRAVPPLPEPGGLVLLAGGRRAVTAGGPAATGCGPGAGQPVNPASCVVNASGAWAMPLQVSPAGTPVGHDRSRLTIQKVSRARWTERA